MRSRQLISAIFALLVTFSMQAFADLADDLAALGENPTQEEVNQAVDDAFENGETPAEIAAALEAASIPVSTGAAAMAIAGMNPTTVSNAYLDATGDQSIASLAQSSATQNQGQGGGRALGLGQGQGQGSGTPGGGSGGGGPSPSS